MIKPVQIQTYLENGTVSIASSASLSGAIDMHGFALVGILLPDAFTGTALTFQMSDSFAGTYVDIKAGAGAATLTYTVAQGNYYAIDPKDFMGVRYLKVKSGSTEGGTRSLILSFRGVL